MKNWWRWALAGRGHPTTPKPRLARFADPVPNLSQFVGDGVLDVPAGVKFIAHCKQLRRMTNHGTNPHYGICVICPRNGQDRSLQIVLGL